MLGIYELDLQIITYCAKNKYLELFTVNKYFASFNNDDFWKMILKETQYYFDFSEDADYRTLALIDNIKYRSDDKIIIPNRSFLINNLSLISSLYHFIPVLTELKSLECWYHFGSSYMTYTTVTGIKSLINILDIDYLGYAVFITNNLQYMTNLESLRCNYDIKIFEIAIKPQSLKCLAVSKFYQNRPLMPNFSVGNYVSSIYNFLNGIEHLEIGTYYRNYTMEFPKSIKSINGFFRRDDLSYDLVALPSDCDIVRHNIS